MSSTYAEFLSHKADSARADGMPPAGDLSRLYEFQQDLVEWSLRLGRAAMFADCGLGKTPMQLYWSNEIVRKTNKSVLILTPLAVSSQTLREAEKFGLEAHRYSASARPSIYVTNYEQLHKVNLGAFAGIVCDESSILKNFDGARRGEITAAMKTVPYRLLCTATAAPNDYVELGTSSEAIGHLGHMDMLTRFFVNDQHSSHPNRLIAGNAWRFKGHAADPFWRWVATWARACRKPSDLGYDNDGFILPPIQYVEHIVRASVLHDGMLFARPAVDMREERVERRKTLRERCALAAQLVATDAPAVIWCHLNDEGDLLAEMLRGEGVQVSGTDALEEKEEKLGAFTTGQTRVLIIKPKIGAWGLNWQHCAHVVTFASHSYEQFYQAVRRCWRFGQVNPVTVDIVLSEGEQRIAANLRRKSESADAMFEALVKHMRHAQSVSVTEFDQPLEVPVWVS